MRIYIYIYNWMAYIRRKCVWFGKLSPLSRDSGILKTCIIRLEHAKATYRYTREVVLRRCMKYRDTNVEKENQDISYSILIIRKINMKRDENTTILLVIGMCVYIMLNNIEQ